MRGPLSVLCLTALLAGCAADADDPVFALPDGGVPLDDGGNPCPSCLTDGGVPGPAPTAWEFENVYGIPNVDDEGGFFGVPLSSQEDDLATFVIDAAKLEVFDDGDRIALSLTGDTELVRIWLDGEVVMGLGSATEHVLDAGSDDIELDVEFGDLNVEAILELRRIDADGATVKTSEVDLISAPLIMNHHLQPSEHTWVVAVDDGDSYNNNDMLDAYQSVLGSAFTPVYGGDYDWDVWIQDEIEFATATGRNGERLDVVIDSIRDRGLDDFAEDYLVGSGTIAPTWGNPDEATTFDSFGNLEASPPVFLDGADYPFGRIYYGRSGNWGLSTILGAFLASQKIQKPFELDSTWLCVGHVDEFSTFVPDPSSPKGFKLVLADVNAAYDLLDNMPSGASLPRYAADFGYSTAGDISSDSALRALNADLQADYLDPIRAKFKAELGLTDADIILAPTLFEEVSRCNGYVAALMPGMVNLIVTNDSNGDVHLFIPDPFLRSDLGDQGSDPLIAEFKALMPPSLNLHFVDNWYVYHLGLGEVHCGTNVQRTPITEWWSTANAIMGGE